MSRKKHRAARVELDREPDQQPDRHSDDGDERADDQVEPALDDPVGACEDRRPELEERNALPGHVLAPPLDQQLGRARGDPDLHTAPVGLLDDLDELPVVEVGVGHDQLVHVALRQHGRQRREVAQHRQAGAVGRDRNRADELVVDPAAARAERPPKAREALALADENRAPPDARELEQVAGDDVVASAQEADADRGQDDRRRRKPVRPEAVARAEREDQRDHRDERERGDDPAEPAAPLALGIEPRLPEDEHRDQGQERQPIGLGIPQEGPRGACRCRRRARAVRAQRRPRAPGRRGRGRRARRCSPRGARRCEAGSTRSSSGCRRAARRRRPRRLGAADDGGRAGGACSVATGRFMIRPADTLSCLFAAFA